MDTTNKLKLTSNLFPANIAELMSDLPMHVFSKNYHGYYINCNKRMATDLGLEKPEDIIQQRDLDLVWTKHASTLRSNDCTVTSKKEQGEFLEKVIFHNNATVVLLSFKFPLKNNLGKTCGVFGLSLPLIGQVINNQRDNIWFSHLEKLSKRELECFHLMARGMSAKQISLVLDLSHRTIETYIDSLKTKFNCYNKYKLIEIYYTLFPDKSPYCSPNENLAKIILKALENEI